MSETVTSIPIKTWQTRVRTPEQMSEVERPLLIEKFLPPGVSFFGGPAGHGKSWLALSMAKALHFGTPFLGHFTIPKAIPIIYLVPEVGEAMMKQRLNALRIGNIKDGFFMQTMSSGAPVDLREPYLIDAVKDLKPALFLDTAIRFNKGLDENDSTENKRFVDSIFNLLQQGAQAIVPLHHSIKSLAGGELEPSLENVLRGTGDFGAMADAVYSILCSDKKHFITEITNVKSRDFTPVESFEVQGRPYIDETGDLCLLRAPDFDKEDFEKARIQMIDSVLKDDPTKSLNDLAKVLNVRKEKAKVLANKGKWFQTGRKWEKMRSKD